MREKAIVAVLTLLLLVFYAVSPALAGTGTVTIRDRDGNVRDNNLDIPGSKSTEDDDNEVEEDEKKKDDEPGLLDKLNPTIQGKKMVGEGIMYFLELLADSGFKVGMSEATDVSDIKDNYGYAVAAIYNMATVEFDPYENEFIKEMQIRLSFISAFLIFIYAILGSFQVNMFALKPTRHADTAYILSNRYHIPINEYALTLVEITAMVTFGYLIMRVTLWMELFITKLIMFQILDRIAPTGGNTIMYLMMSLCYLLIGIAIAYRILIVGMFHASYIVFIALYAFGVTRPVAITAFWYYMKMLFLRPIIVGITVIGVGIISEFKVVYDSTTTTGAAIEVVSALVSNFIIQPLMYSALIIVLVIVCLAMVLGVKNIINASRYAMRRYAYGMVR